MPVTFFKYDPSSIDPKDLFPMDEMREADLEVRVRSEVKDQADVAVLQREIFYTSHEFRGEKIRIAAHIAIPESESPLPAMILGSGNMDQATAFSRQHNVVTMAIDRVGTGDSNGPPDSYNQAWLDLAEDMRDGWMIQYVYNTLRAITYLQTLPEVQPDRIGVTGSSRGGTMTLIANGVDDRIALAVPKATCGDILTAFEHDGWANFLYQHEDGSQGIPPKFRAFSIHGDPTNYANSQNGHVMLILGAQDEYFPIYTVKTFCDAVTSDMRLCLIPDWDHGLFSADRPEIDTYDNRVEASRRMDAAMQYAIECHLHCRNEMPRTPLLSWLYREGKLLFDVGVSTHWPIEQVDLQYSADGAYFFKKLPLKKVYDTFKERYVGELEVSAEDLQRLCFFVEAKYVEGPFVMSPPQFGLGFQQHMRNRPSSPPAQEPDYHREDVTHDDCRFMVACNRAADNLPVVLLFGDEFTTREQVAEEAVRLSKRGLFAVGLHGDSAVRLDAVLAVLRERFSDHANLLNLHLLGFGSGAAKALGMLANNSTKFRSAVLFSPVGEMTLTIPSDQTELRIIADLDDDCAELVEAFERESANAGAKNVAVYLSHLTDGLRWRRGWPADQSVLRRAEEKYFRLFQRKLD